MISVVELYRKMVFTTVFSKFYRKTVALVPLFENGIFDYFWNRKSFLIATNAIANRNIFIKCFLYSIIPLNFQ